MPHSTRHQDLGHSCWRNHSRPEIQLRRQLHRRLPPDEPGYFEDTFPSDLASDLRAMRLYISYFVREDSVSRRYGRNGANNGFCQGKGGTRTVPHGALDPAGEQSIYADRTGGHLETEGAGKA